MSAYLVDPEDIQALVQYAEQHNLLPEGLNRATTARAIGRANLESVEYRYPDTREAGAARHFWTMSNQNYLKVVAEPFTGDALSHAQAARLCGTVEYQSCERPDWPQSPVRRWLEAWGAFAELTTDSVIKRLYTYA